MSLRTKLIGRESEGAGAHPVFFVLVLVFVFVDERHDEHEELCMR